MVSFVGRLVGDRVVPLVGSSVVPLTVGGSVVGGSVTTGIPVHKIYNRKCIIRGVCT